MANLTYNKVWLRPNEKPLQHQSCIIFDWDDTILCTTFLVPYQRYVLDYTLKLPTQLKDKMKELDEVAYQLLRESKQFGKTYIVTNAAEGWVELSSSRFLPKTA